jgi:hypothetical protein
MNAEGQNLQVKYQKLAAEYAKVRKWFYREEF